MTILQAQVQPTTASSHSVLQSPVTHVPPPPDHEQAIADALARFQATYGVPTRSATVAPVAAEPQPAPAEVEDPDAPGHEDGLIPAPGKNTFRVGPLTFHKYGLALGVGGVTGGLIFQHMVKNAGLPTGTLMPVVGGAVAAGLVGARLYHVATEWDYYHDHKGDIPKIWNGGIGIWGGVAAGTLVGAALARHAGLHVSPLLDAAAVALPVAQAIGRTGNYLNQELYGKPTDLPWGLQVDPDKRPAGYEDRNSFHPTFAYEAAWNLALAGGIYGLSKVWKHRPPGMLFATYVAGYAIGRFGVEGLRIDPAKEAGGLRTNQWTSLGMLGAAGVGAAALALKARA